MTIRKMGIVVCLLLGVQASFAATSYTGSLSTDGSDPGLVGVAGSQWATGVNFSWLVSWVAAANVWQYYYTLETSEKDISHALIETSDFFDLNRIASGSVAQSSSERVVGSTQSYSQWIASNSVSWTSTTAESDDWGSAQGDSNPLIPGTLHGLKFTPSSDTTSHSFTFMTDVQPVWGDFYAKDGVTKTATGQKIDNAVWNSGFAPVFVAAHEELDPETLESIWVPDFYGDIDPATAPTDGSLGYHILRPDTVGGSTPPTPPVPELPPAALLTLLPAAVGVVRRMKRR